eukprot:2433561-Prymnesium_polylepis.1
MVQDAVIKVIEGIGKNLVEKKLADSKSFDDIVQHFEHVLVVYRCSIQPWATTNPSVSSLEERQADVSWYFRNNVDKTVERMKRTRDTLIKDVMREFARICFEKNFAKTINAPGIDLYPFRNGVQELSAPFGFRPATPSDRISGP